MVIRNNLLGGNDWVNEAINEDDLNDTNNAIYNKFYRKVFADNTGASISNSTTETDLATITIPQNTLGNSFSTKINSGVTCTSQINAGATTTIRVYVGGVVVKTQSLDTSSSTVKLTISASINQYITGLDSTTGNIIVKITAQHSVANSSLSAVLYGMVVDCVNNNS